MAGRLVAGVIPAHMGHHGGPKPGKKPVNWGNAWREASTLIREHRHRLALGLVLLVVGRAASLVLPGSAGFLIDTVVAQHHPEWLWPLAGAVVVAGLIQAGTAFALSQLLGIAGQQAINDLRLRVHAHVLRLPVARFDATQSGTLISRIMSDAEGVRNLVGTGIVQLVGGLITAFAVLGILIHLNAALTGGILVILVIFGGLLATTFRRLRPLFRERQKVSGEISGTLGQVLQGVRVVKVFTAEQRLQQRFATDTGRLFEMIRTTMTGFSLTAALTLVVLALVGALVVVMGGNDLLAGRMTVGNLLQFVLFTGLLAAPIGQMANIGTQITEAFAGLDRIRELMQQPTEPSGPVTCPPLAGRVEFSGVSFAYDVGRPVLTDITLVAPAGQTIALVGPSGSGKSTLASLVLAFAHPGSGTITIDGRDLTTLELQSYRRQLGVVLQDNWLLDGTVRDNLRFARPEATEAEVTAACQAAAAEAFVAALPQGLDTIVGERGVKLSGGQRQRLAIARALLADPRILVLDEATSALDSESEAEIQGALARLRAGRTTFVIAHRLSTIRGADCILVLDGGKIVERGTHQELLEHHGLYRRLHDRQHQVAADRHINPGEELRPG